METILLSTDRLRTQPAKGWLRPCRAGCLVRGPFDSLACPGRHADLAAALRSGHPAGRRRPLCRRHRAGDVDEPRRDAVEQSGLQCPLALRGPERSARPQCEDARDPPSGSERGHRFERSAATGPKRSLVNDVETQGGCVPNPPAVLLRRERHGTRDQPAARSPTGSERHRRAVVHSAVAATPGAMGQWRG